MRIALGVDDVLADASGALRDLTVGIFGTVPHQLSPDQHRQLWRVIQVFENFWETFEEIEPGGVARLAALADERGWEVIFLVRRFPTAGYTAQAQTQHWLAAHGFRRPSVFVVDRALASVAQPLELDVVIDSPFDRLLEPPDQARPGVRRRAAGVVMPRTGAPTPGAIDEHLRRLCALDDRQTPWRLRVARRLRPRTGRQLPDAAAGETRN